MSLTTTSLFISGLLATAATAESRFFKHRHLHARAPAPNVISVEETVTQVVTVYVTAGAAAPSTTLATVSAPAAAVAAPSSVSAVPVIVVPTSSVAAAASSAAVSSSSTSSAAASTSTASAKKGLAFNNANLVTAWADKNVGWAYNWGSARSAAIPSSIPYLPMIWCTNTPLDTWTAAANTAIAAGSTHLLSFNEPDQPGQCDISASAAAAAHQKYLNPFQGRAKISSPAVTNGGGTMGLNFLDTFFQSCGKSCAVDFLAVHWYAPVTGAVDYFKQHITDAITLGAKYGVGEVWITEFGLTGASAADEASFLAQVLPWLNNNTAVGGYAWFMLEDGNLMTGNTISSVVGAAYAVA